MNQIIDWMQNNWYELGSLLAQFTFLFAGLWFAQKILKTMRASQQQVAALLRLSITDGLERPEETGAAPSPTPSVVTASMLNPVADRPAPARMPPKMAPARSSSSYAAFEKPSRGEAPSLTEELSGRAQTSAAMAPAQTATIEPTYEPTPYVAAPLTLPEDERNDVDIAAAGRGVVQWLQTPMSSKSMSSKKKGVSPLRKVVRWLQAPVRSCNKSRPFQPRRICSRFGNKALRARVLNIVVSSFQGSLRFGPAIQFRLQQVESAVQGHGFTCRGTGAGIGRCFWLYAGHVPFQTCEFDRHANAQAKHGNAAGKIPEVRTDGLQFFVLRQDSLNSQLFR